VYRRHNIQVAFDGKIITHLSSRNRMHQTHLKTVIIHSSNGGKVLRMACRRVLSSTPMLVRGSETGGDSGEKKFTN
jgi:hypothetical protein